MEGNVMRRAVKRASQYPNSSLKALDGNHGKLLCRACMEETSMKKSAVESHLRSGKHVRNYESWVAKTGSQIQTEEELPVLTSKINRLEETVSRLQSRIEIMMETLVNHRADQIAARSRINRIMEREEAVCLSVIAQLKSCLDSRSTEESGFGGSNGRRKLRRSRRKRKSSDSDSEESEDTQDTNNTDTDGSDDDGGNISSGHVTNFSQINEPFDDDEVDVFIKPEPIDVDELAQVGDAEHLHEAEMEPLSHGQNKSQSQSQTHATPPPVPPVPNARVGRAQKTYTHARSFSNQEEATEFVQAERTWVIKNSNTTAGGSKVHYRCRFNKSEWNCPVYMYLFNEKATDKVHQFMSFDEHTHTLPSSADHTHEIPDHVKKVIDEIYDEGITSLRLIQQELHQRSGMGVLEEYMVTAQKLQAYLRRAKKHTDEDLQSTSKRRKRFAPGTGTRKIGRPKKLPPTFDFIAPSRIPPECPELPRPDSRNSQPPQDHQEGNSLIDK